MKNESGSRIVRLEDEAQIAAEMQAIGVSPGGIRCMKDKAQFFCLKLKGISCRSANILKQEMLSRGGEAAVSAQTVYAQGNTDVLLMGTALQLQYLVQKLEQQPLGLKNTAAEIQALLNGEQTTGFVLKLPNGKKWRLPYHQTQIMGIVNITPDSFSDGGCFFLPQQAIRQALQLREEGADVIDIGAASSRPGCTWVDAKEEWRRLEPVVQALAQEDMLLSVDTCCAATAARCLDAGVQIVNDIGGLQLDTDMAKVVAEAGCPVVVMHNRLQVKSDTPYTDFLSDVMQDLRYSLSLGREAGIKREQFIVDPGIGFGKTAAQNRLLIRNLAMLKGLGHPILLGLSRKSFIADTLPELSPQERDGVSLALGIMGVLNGAGLLRVHEVKKTRQAIEMIDKVRNENG